MNNETIKTQDEPYTKTSAGVLVSTNEWDIGLLEAIQKESQAITVFKGRDLPFLPVKLIQVNKPVSWMAQGAISRADKGDYIASYRRGDAPEEAAFIARISKDTAEKLIARYQKMALDKEQKSIRNILKGSQDFEIFSGTLSVLIHTDKVKVLYPRKGLEQGIKTPDSIKYVLRFEDNLTFLTPVINEKKRKMFKVNKGETIAVSNQEERACFPIYRIMSEDVDELLHSLRREDRLNRYTPIERATRQVTTRVKKVSRQVSKQINGARERKKERQK